MQSMLRSSPTRGQALGAGYVVLSLGQNHQYGCAPNPVIDKHWGFKPGEFNSRRDLPMDLHKALAKRNINLMLYVTALHYRLPTPDDWSMDKELNDRWIEAVQWYSYKCPAVLTSSKVAASSPLMWADTKSSTGNPFPCLDIPGSSQAHLRAVRDAVKNIPVSDGSGKFASGVPVTSNH